jgi:hypothetical protein
MVAVINGMYDLETLKRLNDEEVERRERRAEVKAGMIAQSEVKVESHNAIERWRVEYSWKQKQYHLSPAECWDNNPDWETLGVFDTLTGAQAKIRELRSINYGNKEEE